MKQIVKVMLVIMVIIFNSSAMANNIDIRVPTILLSKTLQEYILVYKVDATKFEADIRNDNIDLFSKYDGTVIYLSLR